jgi:cobalt-zinc-cadmium efflux system outer membrane protein
MMPLQDLWLIPARRKVAKAALQQAVLRVADRAIEIAAEVRRVYARLQYAQRALGLLAENLELVDQSTRIISTRQAAGRATQVQVNLSQIRRMKLRSDFITMQAEFDALQRELLMLMGLAAAPTRWSVEPLSELNDEISEPIEETLLVATALEQRLDVLAANWETQAAERNVELARREGLPDLAMGFTLERAPAPRSNNQGFAGVAGNAAAQGLYDRAQGMSSIAPLGTPFMPKQREVKWTLGPMLELEVPIFDHGQGKVARAMAEFRRTFALYEARVQEVTRTVREKWLMLNQAHEQVRFYRSDVAPAVERNLDIARRSFIAGQEELTVYLEVQEDLLMTRLRILEFYRDYLVNRAELERSVGGHMNAPAPSTQPAVPPPLAAGGPPRSDRSR